MTHRIGRKAVTVGLVIAALAATLASNGAEAQLVQEGVNINPFRPADLATDGFQMARPITQAGTFGARLTLDYGYRPLDYSNSMTGIDYSIVRHNLTGTLALTFRLHDRITVGLGLPMSIFMHGSPAPMRRLHTAEDGQLSDIYVMARARILGEEGDRFILGAQLKLTLPTADMVRESQLFTGDETVTFSPTVLAEINATDRFRINLSAGARLRGIQRKRGLYVGQEMTYGLGLTYEIVDDVLDLTGELYGTTDFGYYPNHNNQPLEGIAGLQAHIGDNWHLGAAVGAGMTTGYGNAQFRGVLNLAYATDPVDRAPEPEPEPVVVPEPDLDADDDTINDDVDRCPQEPEDMDGFEDEDGCADADNDHDGVLDAADASPNDPEDIDSFQDEDGTPDPDNDSDGVPDGRDTCPLEPEDIDGLADENGCPEDDADSDTIADAVDHCPLTPGVISARNPECSGCPAAACIDPAGNIRILQRIEFESNSDAIKAISTPVLESVRDILSTTPGIRRVRIEGHTDDRGNDARNLELSQRRAASVLTWLASHGIDTSRLEAVGFGETHPLMAGRSAAARAANRRVEFHITDPAPPTPTP